MVNNLLFCLKALVTVLRVWNDAMMEELDFVTESRNLLEVSKYNELACELTFYS